MVVRLLLTLLLATGVAPFRGCDCAAADPDHARLPHDDGGDHPHPADHDADCPLLQPAADLPAPVVPAVAAPAAPLPVPPVLAPLPGDRLPPRVEPEFRPPAVPLYLSLRALRN